ncbi:MAG: efflux RND transporter periplasmic adaptor subunit [Proteobacteria bacterium]|nr:efflux RND transporter periplasmic adaptor subunit [Pseudomonadota bacterium]
MSLPPESQLQAAPPGAASAPGAGPVGGTSRKLWLLLLIALLLAAWGIVSRLGARAALDREARAAAIITVATVRPTLGPASDELELPGTVQAFYEAPIYARTSGYLRAWYTDIGATVKKGQLLALIETPEVDQQLRQAQADLATATANYELARTTNERWQGLLATQSVSQQDADQRAGDASAKAAARQSAAANLQRLRELSGFKRVVAPFDGVVTQRNTDIGALINAGQSSGNALFRVADTHRLRIYVAVPQAYAAGVKAGVPAQLEFSDRPGRRYEAQVVNTARALDAGSRTLQVELQIDNSAAELLPGSYAQVHLNLHPDTPLLRIPVNTVLFRSQGQQVAVIDGTRHVHLRNITQGRDFGKEIEVLSGISPQDVLVVNPPDSLDDGALVRLAPVSSVGSHGSAAAAGGARSP